MSKKKSSQKRKSNKNRPKGTGGSSDAAGSRIPVAVHAPSKKNGGCSAGPVPNLFWGYVSMDELRTCPRFVSLPECATEVHSLPYLAAARYIRQDSPSWRQMHAGVLSTGLLKEALGLREPLAARVVGGRNESSHAPLLAAFQHLRQPSQLPPPHVEPGLEGSWRRQAVQSLLQNMQRQFHQQQLHDVHRLGPKPKQQLAVGPGSTAEAGLQDSAEQEERNRQCNSALRDGGLLGVRCAWGRIQEAAALSQLLNMFPTSSLHEVGLCCLPPGGPETAAWPDLPPLAASPDALIAHHLVLQVDESDRLREALRAVEEVEAEEKAAGDAVVEGDRRGTHTGFMSGIVRRQRLQTLLQELLERVPWSNSGEGRGDDAEAEGEGEGVCDGGGSGGVSSEEEDVHSSQGCGDEDGEEEDCEEEVRVGDDATSDREYDCGEDCTAESSVSCVDGGCGGLYQGPGILQGPDGATIPAAAAAAPTTVSAATRGLRSNLGATAASAAATAASKAAAVSTGITEVAFHGDLLAAVLESWSPVVLLCGACGGGGHRGRSSSAAESGGEGGGRGVAESGGGSWSNNHNSGGYADGSSARTMSIRDGGIDCPNDDSALVAPERGVGTAPEVPAGPRAQEAAMGAEGGSGSRAQPTAGVAGGKVWCPQDPAVVWCACDSSGNCGGATAAAAGVGAPHPSPVHVVVREVVEVKNTCPFGIRQVRRGGKSHMSSEIMLCDRGPRCAVSPLWVPQLQLHMLTAGCQSGLLVSRSATKGTTVFRMLRNDEYITRMLGILNRFSGNYVRRGVPPPRDMFASQPEYRAFLAATTRLARNAVQLTVEGRWRPPKLAAPPLPPPVLPSLLMPADVARAVESGGGMTWQWLYNCGGDVGGDSRGHLDRDEAFLRRET